MPTDVKAIEWYKQKLKSTEDGYGYTIVATSSPVDIVATKDGKTYYFEVKSQSKIQKNNSIKGYYDGYVSLEQLKLALKYGNTFKFVILRKRLKNQGDGYKIFELCADEIISNFSGGWKLTHNFHVNFENPSGRNIRLCPGKKDPEKIRKEITEIDDFIKEKE